MNRFSMKLRYRAMLMKRHITSGADLKLRNDILELALQNVPTTGWTNDSIAKAVQTIGLPPLSHSIIERGAVEVVEYFLEKKRKHVHTYMTGLNVEESKDELHKDDILIKALESHFEYIQPYLPEWSSALALLVDPNKVSFQTFSPVIDVVNDLCEFTDIKTSRLNWYSERGMLACLYGSTEMYLLTDKSENLHDTKQFLRRNVETYNLLCRSPSTMFGLMTVAMRMARGTTSSSSSSSQHSSGSSSSSSSDYKYSNSSASSGDNGASGSHNRDDTSTSEESTVTESSRGR